MQISEMEQKNKKHLLVLKIIAFESRIRNSHNPKQDICHWESICYQTPLTINISLREIFSKSRSPRVMKKSDESAFLQILQEFGTL